VSSAPLAASGVRVISHAETGARRLTAGGSTAYWIGAGNEIRQSVGSAAPTTLVSVPDLINGLALSPDGTVYFSMAASVYRVTTGGAGPTTVEVAREVHGGVPQALAVSSDVVAFPNGPNSDVDAASLVQGQVAICGDYDPTGTIIATTCERLSRNHGNLLQDTIVITPSGVVWANDGNIERRLHSTSSGFDTITGSQLGDVSGFVTDGTHVYFADTSGTLYKALLAPNQPALRIARGQQGARSLAIGGGSLFWSTADCAIRSSGL
jgi:hypothetical protein